MPAKTLPSSSHNQAEVSLYQLCNVKTKTASAFDDVELASVPDTLRLKAPAFFLFTPFLFSWIARLLIQSENTGYSGSYILPLSSVPIYLKLRRMVYYA